MNLSTGKPFQFEVPDEKIARWEYQRGLVREGKGSPMLGSIEELISIHEFSIFPAYQEILKIWFENGYTEELMTEILVDFGVTEPFIQKLLEDQAYVEHIKPWFEGITCDGARSARTLAIIYSKTKQYFSP